MELPYIVLSMFCLPTDVREDSDQKNTKQQD